MPASTGVAGRFSVRGPALRDHQLKDLNRIDQIDVLLGRLADPSLFLRPPQVAAVLGLSLPAVYRYLRLGEIPSRRIGSAYLIPRRQFEEWIGEKLRDRDIRLSERGVVAK